MVFERVKGPWRFFLSLLLLGGIFSAPAFSETAEEWITKGKAEKTSRKKIECFNKAIALDASIAEAWYRRGHAFYYYVVDAAAGAPGGGSAPGSKGYSMDPDVQKNIESDTVVTVDGKVQAVDYSARKDQAKSDYDKAIALDRNYSDAYYERGVYWFWKGVKADRKKLSSKSLYDSSLSDFNSAITRDAQCSTAYDFRSRLMWRANDSTSKTRDTKIRDDLRSPEYYTLPTFFEHCDYGGWSRTFGLGTYDMPSQGINDLISSIKVSKLYNVTVYQHTQYAGASLAVNSNSSISCLTGKSMDDDHSWNDQISCIHVAYRDGIGQTKTYTTTFPTTPPSAFKSKFVSVPGDPN